MSRCTPVGCPCSICSPHLYATQKIAYAPGSSAPLARLIDQYEIPEIWDIILPLLNVERLRSLMCVSRTTNAQIGFLIQKELRERSKCTHRDTLETGILHCFTHRAVFRFSDCRRCGTQAHWHTKVWEEVEFEERREPFLPRMVMVRCEEHRGNVRAARRDLAELADRLGSLALQ